MLKRGLRFIKKFFSALGRGFLEQVDIVDFLGDGIGGFERIVAIFGLLAMAAFLCLVYGFLNVGYELMFDPNATDVASRLAALSISPEKWM